VTELFGLREYLNEKGLDLSGGLKRRVQVAKAFMIDKPIVFLDEATTGMDAFNKRATIEAIKENARKGRTFILTTHILDEAEELCDAVAIVNRGRIIAGGSVEDVKSMSLRLLYLTLSLKTVSEEVLRTIQEREPLHVDIKNNTIEVTVREATAALDVLTAVKQTGSLEHFEITSASLEDIFLQLVDKKASID
jgi:ABC-2 type transport system ATP-binding protein